MPEEQLWIQGGKVKYGDEVKVVCERESCAGPDLFAAIVQARGLEPSVEVDGVVFDRMTRAEMIELGAVLSQVPGFALGCDGGHVEWDVRTQTLTSTAPTATSIIAEQESP